MAKTLAPVTGAVTPVVTTVAKTLAPVTGAVTPGRDRGQAAGAGHRGGTPVVTTVAKTLAPVTGAVTPGHDRGQPWLLSLGRLPP